MHGLMRVRAFTQDDGHIFCTEQQIENETSQFISLLSSVYEDLGFKSFDIRLSTRPEIRVGDDSVWDRSEAALEQAIQKLSIPYLVQPGEGAFYGPKLDFVLQDAIGREWQCGTFQLDFILPERLNAEYVNEKGEKVRPVMIHRAILGSFERFIGILLENYSGKLPLWLAPTQISILSVTEDANDYCNKLKEIYESEGIRVNLDIRNEKIGYKIREHSSQKTQLMAIIGMDEVNSKTVSIRDIFTSETETLEQSESISKVLELCKKP
jgi:threonyl-tRNA synthetase